VRAADSVTREVLKHLPFVKEVFRNRREDYHLTIWHTSKAVYPCPDAMHKTGGVDPTSLPSERQAPTQVLLRAAGLRQTCCCTFRQLVVVRVIHVCQSVCRRLQHAMHAQGVKDSRLNAPGKVFLGVAGRKGMFRMMTSSMRHAAAPPWLTPSSSAFP
jgi:hypothetical protein